jgi:hypothetical protein
VSPDAVLASLRSLRVPVLVLLGVLGIVLPVVSLFSADSVALLAVFAAYYVVIAVTVGLAVRLRKRVELDGRSYGMLLLDVVLCPPFAINLIRRVTLARGLRMPPVAFARAHFGPEAMAQLTALGQQPGMPSWD